MPSGLLGGVTLVDGTASGLTLDATCDVTLATGAGAGPATQLDANGTTLDVDAIADGEFLVRSGTSIIGSAGGGGGISAGVSAGLNFWGAW